MKNKQSKLQRSTALLLVALMFLPLFSPMAAAAEQPALVEQPIYAEALLECDPTECSDENDLTESDEVFCDDANSPEENADDEPANTEDQEVPTENQLPTPNHTLTQNSVQAQFINTGLLIPIPTAWRQSGLGLARHNSQFFQLSIGGALTPAYCLQPRVPAPPSGTYAASQLANNTLLARGLFYSFGAPGQRYYLDSVQFSQYSETSHTGSRRGDTLYMLSHLTLSYIYLGGFGAGFEGINATGRAAILNFYNFIVNAPHPPSAEKYFDNANLVASMNGSGDRQYTPWTTFNADHRNQITIPAPSGAQIQSSAGDGSWTSAWSDSVTVRGGERVRFRSNTPNSAPAGTWTSPPIHGTENRHWLSIIFNQASNTQTMGGFSQAIDPVPPITISVQWQESLGSLRIVKTVEHWDTRAGFEFEVYRVSDNHFIGRFTSPVSGEIYIPDLVAGDYTIREIVPSGFVAPTPNPRTVTVVAGQTATSAPSTTFHNIRQLGRIRIEKQDITTGTRPQGDATLSGAVFHLYRANDVGGTPVEVLDTGDAAYIWTDYHPLGDFVIREVEPPRGYTLAQQDFPVTLSYGAPTVHVVLESVEVHNRVIQGRIAVIKFTDPLPGQNQQIMPPLEGAIFEIYLRAAGSFEEALPTERGRIVTNEHGFAETIDLPFGWYRVVETYAPGDRLLVPPFYVFINEDGQVHRFILHNPMFTSHVRIVKVDATTGEQIPTAGVGFRVRDLATGEWVSQSLHYPTPMTIDVFHTNEYGYLVMPEALPSGNYELHEKSAPYGYLLSEEPVPFTIHSDFDNEENIIEVVMENMPAMGVISIEKVCALTQIPLEDAIFAVFAALDIITPDGTIRARAGEVVALLVTDENGHAKTAPLFLGEYEVVEVGTPPGFLIDFTPIPVTLAYADQYTPIVFESLTIENRPIRGRIVIEKICAETGEPLEGAEFEVFDEDRALVDTIITGGDGFGYSRELPMGTYFVKETVAPTGFFIPYPIIHEVTLEYGDQTVEIVHEFITVENQRIRGRIEGYKVCATTGEPLEGATFGLFLHDETNFTTDTAVMLSVSNEYGLFYFLDLAYGDWLVRELEAPEGFRLTDEIFEITIGYHEQIVGLRVENERTPDEPEVPRTGDDSERPWPLLIVAVAGMIGVAVGMIVLNRKGEKHDKKD